MFTKFLATRKVCLPSSGTSLITIATCLVSYAWQQLYASAEWYRLHSNSCMFELRYIGCIATEVYLVLHIHCCMLQLSDIGCIATVACLVLCAWQQLHLSRYIGCIATEVYLVLHARQQLYASAEWYWLHSNSCMFKLIYWLHSNTCIVGIVCMETGACLAMWHCMHGNDRMLIMAGKFGNNIWMAAV